MACHAPPITAKDPRAQIRFARPALIHAHPAPTTVARARHRDQLRRDGRRGGGGMGRRAGGSSRLSCAPQFVAASPYGGVVPEIAARAHLEALDGWSCRRINDPARLADIDAVAATQGPGLIGGLMVGLSYGQGDRVCDGQPLIAVNHLEAHALTPGSPMAWRRRICCCWCQAGTPRSCWCAALVGYRPVGHHHRRRVGRGVRQDREVAWARLSGGAGMERLACAGNRRELHVPRPMKGRPEPHFSFTGLKDRGAARDRTRTPGRRIGLAAGALPAHPSADRAPGSRRRWSQPCPTGSVAPAPSSPRERFAASDDGRKKRRTLVVSGGVAPPAPAYRTVTAPATAAAGDFAAPALSTDNAAMIAWTGAERLAHGLTDRLDTPVRVRWPLDPVAVPALGAGRHGAKA